MESEERQGQGRTRWQGKRRTVMGWISILRLPMMVVAAAAVVVWRKGTLCVEQSPATRRGAVWGAGGRQAPERQQWDGARMDGSGCWRGAAKVPCGRRERLAGWRKSGRGGLCAFLNEMC